MARGIRFLTLLALLVGAPCLLQRALTEEPVEEDGPPVPGPAKFSGSRPAPLSAPILSGRPEVRTVLDGKRKFVRGRIFVRANPGKVWKVLADYPLYPEFMPNTEGCAVVGRRGPDRPIVRQDLRFRFGFVSKHVWYVLDMQHYRKAWRIRWRMIPGEGNIDDAEGSWQLVPRPDAGGTLAVYTLRVEPGFLIPGFVARALTRGNLPDLLRAVKGRSERRD